MLAGGLLRARRVVACFHVCGQTSGQLHASGAELFTGLGVGELELHGGVARPSGVDHVEVGDGGLAGRNRLEADASGLDLPAFRHDRGDGDVTGVRAGCGPHLDGDLGRGGRVHGLGVHGGGHAHVAGEREQRVVADQVSRELSDGASGGTMGLQIDVLLVAGGDGETLLRQRRGDGVLAILVGADLPLLRVTLIGGVALILTDGHVGAVAQFRRRADLGDDIEMLASGEERKTLSGHCILHLVVAVRRGDELPRTFGDRLQLGDVVDAGLDWGVVVFADVQRVADLVDVRLHIVPRRPRAGIGPGHLRDEAHAVEDLLLDLVLGLVDRAVGPDGHLRTGQFVVVLVDLSSAVKGSDVPVVVVQSCGVDLVHLRRTGPVQGLGRVHQRVSVLDELLRLAAGTIPVFDDDVLVQGDVLGVDDAVVPDAQLLALGLDVFIYVVDEAGERIIRCRAGSVLLFGERLQLAVVVEAGADHVLVGAHVPVFRGEYAVVFVNQRLVELHGLRVGDVELVGILPA